MDPGSSGADGLGHGPVRIPVSEPSLDRALMRLGIHDDTARIIAATPSLRASWLVAASIAVVFAIIG